MANWSKRRTTKAGSSGQRITRTTNSSGKSTYSSSKRVGNTRTTTSISSNGKVRTYTTEHHPILGTRRTVRTDNKQPRVKKPSKPKKTRKVRAKKYKSSSYSYSSGTSYSEPSAFSDWFYSVSFWWWAAAFVLLIGGAAWYIWLIYLSAFLKFNVDIFK